MTGDELRALAGRIAADRARARDGGSLVPAPAGRATADTSAHPSHAVYVSIVNVDDACVIEPGVGCHHCDYCRSHGH